MTDYLGNELAVGDKVIMIRLKSRELVMATILRFTEKYVFLQYKMGEFDIDVKQTPDQLAKIKNFPLL